jgi:hypothetical protein
VDIGQLRRIRGGVRGAIESASGRGALGAAGLVDVFNSSLESIEAAVDDELRAELHANVPALAGLTGDLLEDANIRASAATRLGQLGGWLDGLIEHLESQERVAAEAEAYARERVRQDWEREHKE